MNVFVQMKEVFDTYDKALGTLNKAMHAKRLCFEDTN